MHFSAGIFHCTFYKCGSQWVRDVLSDPAIVNRSRCSLVLSGHDVPSSTWPTLEEAGLASPVYTADATQWLGRSASGHGDRCLVVLRDPRDIIVSLVTSLSLSHTPNEVTSLLRIPLRNAGDDDRILIGIHLFSHWAGQFRSWLECPSAPDLLLVDYAALISDGQATFRLIFDFFGWDIPNELAEEVIGRHSFAATSGGRVPGEENEFSHRRKGISGDWKNHFNQKTGSVFEGAFPGLLRQGGYEADDRWWESLPIEVARQASDADEKLNRSLRVLSEQETQLRVVREAAEQRLRDVETLTTVCELALGEREMYRQAATERLLVIESLDRELKEYRRAEVERVGDSEALKELCYTVQREVESEHKAAAERRAN